VTAQEFNSFIFWGRAVAGMACVGAPKDVVEAAMSGRFSSTSWVKYQSSTSISLQREFTSPDIYLKFVSAVQDHSAHCCQPHRHLSQPWSIRTSFFLICRQTDNLSLISSGHVQMLRNSIDLCEKQTETKRRTHISVWSTVVAQTHIYWYSALVENGPLDWTL
jgi:hypothetical protein